MPISLPMLLAVGGGGLVLWKMFSKPSALTEEKSMPSPGATTTTPAAEVATPVSDRPLAPVERPIQTIYDLLNVKMVPFNDASMVMQITKVDIPNNMIYGRVIAGSQAGEEFDMSADTVLERLRAGSYRQVA